MPTPMAKKLGFAATRGQEVGMYLELFMGMAPARQIYCDMVILFGTDDLQNTIVER